MASVVVGLGKTGASCLRFFARHGIPASATDSRPAPPGLAELGPLAGQFDVRLGGFDLSLLDGASQVLMSPGVSLDEPIARAARARGIEVLGDVELFARAVRAPVIGVTGTNGKSTVTSLVAHMAATAGRRVLAGGNLGVPALDLLDQPAPDLYVLELSSFQLETTSSLELVGAVVLNVSADHMDRYATVEDYARAKARIFAHAATAVVNADDPWVALMGGARTQTFSTRSDADYCLIHEGSGLVHEGAALIHGGTGFIDERTGLNHEGSGVLQEGAVSSHGVTGSSREEAGLNHERSSSSREGSGSMREGTKTLLARHGEPVLELSRMKITGLHNAANALAALALGDAVGLPLGAMRSALESFPGLPHRSQWVADRAGVRYVDDSKGTNVGATLAAVDGLAGPLVMIAGGVGKGQDFAPLAAAFRGKVRHVVLIGRDAPAIEQVLAGVCSTERAASMEAAVAAAERAAQAGDTVLLSPACASLDMFRDYGERGEVFAAAVRALGPRAAPGSGRA